MRRKAEAAEAAVAILVPYLVGRPDVNVLARRRRLVVWSSGLARLLSDVGAVVRRYGRRRVAVIEEALFKHVKKVMMSRKRMRRAVRRRMQLVVAAFDEYSPRNMQPQEIRERLRRLLGPRLGARIYNTVVRRLRTKRWTRRALNYRGYGFMVRVWRCVRSAEEQYDAPYWTIMDACVRYVRGYAFALADLARYNRYTWWGSDEDEE